MKSLNSGKKNKIGFRVEVFGTWGLIPENPENFSGPKSQLSTAIRLFRKADLLTCFYCKKNREDSEVWWLRTSALRSYNVNCGIQNRPEKFRDFGKQALGHKLWLTISSLHVNARTWAEASISRKPFWNCARKKGTESRCRGHISIFPCRAVFKWLSKNQNQSNYSDQSQQEQPARWTNHNS